VKFWYNPNFIAIFFLVIFSTFALYDLIKPGFYTSHDGETHTARIAQYYIALEDGQFPPRWAKTLQGGLGSPIFVYIYPLPYLLGSAVHFLGISFTGSFKIIMAASFIFSAIFSYLWLKELLSSSKAAFVGSMFYVWAPYRFSLIYVRGSLSETLAYTFLPLLFLTLTKLSKKISLMRIATCALALAALLLSQNLIGYMASLVIIVYVAILAVNSKSLKFLAAAAIAALWGFLISSVTYIPVLFERKLIHFDELFQLVYRSHFVTLGQLIHSPWGYGFDLPGVVNDQISVQIGLAHILVLVLASLLIVLLTVKTLISLKNSSHTRNISFAIFFTAVAFVATFLTLENRFNIFIWDNFKPIEKIDIPWRFLGITTLGISFLAAYIAKNVKSAAFTIFLIFAVIFANRNHLRINKSIEYSDDYFFNYSGSATQLNEFTPRTRYSTGVTDAFVSPIESIKGNILIYDFIRKSNELSFKTQNNGPARIQVNLIKFSNWQTFMDGKKFTTDPSIVDKSFSFAYRPDIDTSGLYELIIPAGSHKFDFRYQETNLRRIADILSLVGLISALVALFPPKRFKEESLVPI